VCTVAVSVAPAKEIIANKTGQDRLTFIIIATVLSLLVHPRLRGRLDLATRVCAFVRGVCAFVRGVCMLYVRAWCVYVVCLHAPVCLWCSALGRYFVLPFTMAALHSPAFARATSGSSGSMPPLPLLVNLVINGARLLLRCHFMLQTEYLPRQARDKPQEKLNEGRFCLQARPCISSSRGGSPLAIFCLLLLLLFLLLLLLLAVSLRQLVAGRPEPVLANDNLFWPRDKRTATHCF
jgi:hypothetical protein